MLTLKYKMKITNSALLPSFQKAKGKVIEAMQYLINRCCAFTESLRGFNIVENPQY